jgi:CDP-glucose 4,6-dehydratase
VFAGGGLCGHAPKKLIANNQQSTNMLQHFRDKRIFVTGHTGFKGTWLLLLLRRLGATVGGYALAAEPHTLYAQINGDGLCESTIADIRDGAALEKAIADFQPDIVFHLAAQPLVLDSYNRPIYTFEVNAIGTAQLLEAVKQINKPCEVVVITTDKVYENREWWYPYREVDALGGYDPYSASKACAEIVTASYRNSFFNSKHYAQHQKAIASGRAGNVIGGGDWAENRIIPDIVRALNAGKAVELRNPKAVRPWQHVLEALYGYLLLAVRLHKQPAVFGDAFNFGPLYDEAISVERLAQIALEVWGGGEYKDMSDSRNTPHEAHLLRLDCSKAVQQLGWLPRWNAQQAIHKTMEWYKAVSVEGQTALEVTQKQIEAYLLV